MERNVTKFDTRVLARRFGERKHFTGDEIIERFLRKYNSENTQRSYKRAIYDFFNWMYNRNVEGNLTPEELIVDTFDAEDYEYECKQRLDEGIDKTTTFNARLKGLKSFYKWLVLNTTSDVSGVRVFTVNPFAVVKLKSEDLTMEGADFLTDDEIILMLNNPFGESRHLQERNKLILEIGIATAIRNDAFAKITINNIIVRDGNYVIDTIDKGEKPVERPINPCYDRLMEWYEKDLQLRTSDNGTIFNMHPRSLDRLIRRWAKQCGISKKISFHSLRSTTAIKVYHESGDNSDVAQEILNHDYKRTTKNYLRKEKLINHTAEYLVENIKNRAMNKEQEIEREEVQVPQEQVSQVTPQIIEVPKPLTEEDVAKAIKDMDLQTKMKIFGMLTSM